MIDFFLWEPKGFITLFWIKGGVASLDANHTWAKIKDLKGSLRPKRKEMLSSFWATLSLTGVSGLRLLDP